MRIPDTAAAPSAEPSKHPASRVDLEVVIPVHNEEETLARSVLRLHNFLSQEFPYSWMITIADNASVDATPEISQALASDLEHLSVVRLEQKGRGRALRAAWSHRQDRVVA
jgi:glycosyltransferase involved in cell wall biosynthesis